MSETSKRSTIYFKPEVHKALRLKVAISQQSLPSIVNDAVRQALQEDQKDLVTFSERMAEPTMTHEELLNDLKLHGKI